MPFEPQAREAPPISEPAPFPVEPAQYLRPPPRARARVQTRFWPNFLLFVATVGTTFVAHGPWYAVSVLLILLSHEFGHYLAARYYQVPASLPYFIPFAPPLGTMGAVIKMSPYIPNRRALFDIAAAGPLAGIVVAIPVTLYGLLDSQFGIPRNVAFSLGEPLLFDLLAYLVKGARPPGAELFISPAAFAGWVGMFVTAFNLLPMSQLDGGHISYSLLGRRAIWLARSVFVGLIGLSIYFSTLNYLLIMILLLIFGIDHPPTLDDTVDLGRTRRWLGVVLLATFILCFTPTPFMTP